MACDAQTLVDDSECLVQGMSERQLLASIAYQLAVIAGSDPEPDALNEQAKCFIHLSERQLLAIIAWLQCQITPT